MALTLPHTHGRNFMNLPGAVDPRKNGLVRIMKKIVVGGGVILMIFGFVALGAELWRTFTGANPSAIGVETIRWKYIGLAIAILAFGFGIAERGEAVNVFRLAWDGWRFRNTQQPGGKRATDPPSETAPPPVPPERWPPPVRTQRQQRAATESAAADASGNKLRQVRADKESDAADKAADRSKDGSGQ
jgi:hypothetical protein